MELQFSYVGVLYIVAAFICTIIAIFSFTIKKIRLAKIFGILMTSIAIWAFFDYFEISVVTLPLKIFWSQVSYFGIATGATLFFLFCLEYARLEKYIKLPVVLLLFAIPIFTIILVFTNEFHHLHWKEITLETIQGLVIGQYNYGIWFWIFVIHTYFCILGGFILVFRAIFLYPKHFRGQIGALLLATAVTIVGNVIYIFKIVTIIDFTPITFTLNGLILGFSIFNFKFLDILPIATSNLLDYIDDGVLVLDSSNKILDMNQKFANIIHVNASDMIGKNVEDACDTEVELKNLILNFTDIIREIQFEDMPEFFFECRIVPIINENHNSIGKIVILRDATERKQYENALVRLNHELEQKVAEAVVELQHKDRIMILQSRQAAMGKIIENVVHQIKSPLNAISVRAQSFLYNMEEISPDKVKAAMDSIYQSVNYIAKTINDFKGFFAEDTERRDFSVMLSVREAYSIMEKVISDNGITLQFTGEAENDQIKVIGYPHEFSQVIINLLQNSIDAFNGKYIQEPKIELHLEKSDSRVFISITDNAGGISDELLDKIGDIYFTTKGDKGSGLGVYISKYLLAKVGGSLKIRNYNGGAQFIIEMVANPE